MLVIRHAVSRGLAVETQGNACGCAPWLDELRAELRRLCGQNDSANGADGTLALARFFLAWQDAPVPGETIQQRLEVFGAPKNAIRDLRCAPTPDHIRYLDLMMGAEAENGPDAVLEVDSEPLAYVASATSPRALATLRRSLVFRADAPYVLVVHPGKLEIHSLGFDEHALFPPLTVNNTDESAASTFERLFLGDAGFESYQPHAVAERLTKLVNLAIEDLISANVEINDAISLVGRAMFSRFLVDRGIVTARHYSKFVHKSATPEDFFSQPETSFRTCAWLDKTFNGDLLPLSFHGDPRAFASLSPRVFERLQQIMRCEEGPQQVFAWESIDFSHVPAGLLSQVYERQAAKWRGETRKKESIYYTPRRIAEFTVAEAFAQLREEHEDVSWARVLDPAVGGGIFLVSAFRELIAERWRSQGRQPDTAEIREILFHQLSGFDISETALRLTALSLYLAALELDPDPHPPDRLKFKHSLCGHTLHAVSSGKPEVGSLRSLPKHHAAYDIVIGNPPWTAVDKATYAAIQENLVELVSEHPVTVPDTVPDIPFLWASKGWARPGGMIALVMHARLLFKQSPGGIESRNEIASKLDISGILNGSELRQTPVWEKMDAPFCVIFARNRCPQPNGMFFFISPYKDSDLNQQGRLRIDASAAQPISPAQMIAAPTLLKTLFRGTALDVGVLEHIKAQCGGRRISDYWPESYRSEGYRIAPSNKQTSAEHLHGLPDLKSRAFTSTIIDDSSLPSFTRATLHRPRQIEVYTCPLVLLRESPPAPGRSKRISAVSFTSLVYSESIYGWSCAWHPSATRLAKYMYLVFSSELFAWYLLMTSGKFGVERESIYFDDANRFLFRPYEEVENCSRDIDEVFQMAKADRSWYVEESLNQLVNRIYGLDSSQVRTIRETLETRSPYKQSVRVSQAPPSKEQEREFITLIRSGLRPIAREQLEVTKLTAPGRAWVTLCLAAKGRAVNRVTPQYYARADGVGASVTLEFRPDCVMISVLHQRRYWTASRARLLVLELMNEHAKKLEELLS